MEKIIAALVLLNFSIFYVYGSDVKNEDPSLKNYDSYESSTDEEVAARPGKRRGSDSYSIYKGHSEKSPFKYSSKKNRYEEQYDNKLNIPPRSLPVQVLTGDVRRSLFSDARDASGMFTDEFLNKMRQMRCFPEEPKSDLDSAEHLYASVNPSPTEPTEQCASQSDFYVFDPDPNSPPDKTLINGRIQEDGSLTKKRNALVYIDPLKDENKNSLSPVSPVSDFSTSTTSRRNTFFGTKSFSSPALLRSVTPMSAESPSSASTESASGKTTPLIGFVRRLFSPKKSRRGESAATFIGGKYLIKDEDFPVVTEEELGICEELEKTQRNFDQSPIIESGDEEVLKDFEGSAHSKNS